MLRLLGVLLLFAAIAVFVFDAAISLASGEALVVSSFSDLWQRVSTVPDGGGTPDGTIAAAALAFFMALPAWLLLSFAGASLLLATEPLLTDRDVR